MYFAELSSSWVGNNYFERRCSKWTKRGMSVGCICYEISNILQRKKITLKGRKCLTIIELICWIAVFGGMHFSVGFRLDFYIVLCLIPAVGLSFSHQTLFETLKSHRWIDFGGISLAIYLADSAARALVKYLLPEATRNERILPLLIILILLACLVIVSGNIFNKILK